MIAKSSSRSQSQRILAARLKATIVVSLVCSMVLLLMTSPGAIMGPPTAPVPVGTSTTSSTTNTSTSSTTTMTEHGRQSSMEDMKSLRDRDPIIYHAAHGQDNWIVDTLIPSQPTTKTWTFIEAGTFDGTTGSNMYALEKYRNWKGICYEPNPTNFKLVDERRPDCQKINGVLCDPGLTREGKKVQFWELKPPADQESGIFDFMSDDKKERLRDLERDDQVVHKIDLSCHSMAEDVTKYPRFQGRVDLLSLDVEGSELIVFKTIDWDSLSIDIIFAERSHEANVTEYLRSKDYQHVARVGDDNIYFKRDAGAYMDLWREGCKCRTGGECQYKLVYPDKGWLNCQAVDLETKRRHLA